MKRNSEVSVKEHVAQTAKQLGDEITMHRIVPISLVRSITFIVIVLTTANSTITPMISVMNRKIALNSRITWP